MPKSVTYVVGICVTHVPGMGKRSELRDFFGLFLNGHREIELAVSS
jgi:hypothetical protein